MGEDEDIQVATLATLPVDATVSSITAYINGNGTNPYRFAIYSDSGGEPGNLIVETAAEGTSPTEWKTLSVTPTVLTAGNYWLALSMSNKFHDYFYEDTGGQTRFKNHNGAINGYLSTWGTSDGSFTYKVSIYADYTPQ